jgi:hypothetical protein
MKLRPNGEEILRERDLKIFLRLKGATAPSLRLVRKIDVKILEEILA